MKPETKREGVMRSELAYWRDWCKRKTGFDDMWGGFRDKWAKREATRARRRHAKKEATNAD